MYLIIVFPILGYLLLMMVLHFPDLVATTWTALHNQFTTLMLIGIVKNPGATLLVTLQIVFLLVPIVGTLYLCWVIVKGPLRKFVDWTGRTQRNAAIGLASAAGICGVAAAVVIFPPATLFRARTHEPAIITDAQRALSSAQTLSAKVEGFLGSDHFTGTVVLEKPNLARIQIDGSGSLGRFLIVSDGKKLTTYFQDDDQYVEASPGIHGEQINAFVAQQVADFFQPELLSKRPHSQSIDHINVGEEREEVVTYQSATQSLRYYISGKDKLVHRVIRGKDLNQPTAVSTMTAIRIDEPIAATAFTWKLPRTARPAQVPGGFAVPLQK
jgi:outer membrane lipoprotein-sorting protein